MWSLEVTVAPTWEPVSIDEAKDHLRVTGSDEDPLLDALIMAARQDIELRLSRALPTQTRKLRLDGWPCSGRIYLPRPPLQSVSSITYLDANGAEQTLSASLYTVYGGRTTPDHDAPLAYLERAYGASWPGLYAVPESVRVTYVCGWKTAGAIPEPIRQAILVRLADLWEQRESVVAGSVSNLRTIDALLANHRVYHEFGEDCG